LEKQKELKIGVIGLGKMGILHTALLNVIPSAKLVALSDINRQLSTYVKNSGLGVPFYSDLNKMLNEVEMDAVVVCTPPFANFSIVKHCVEKNLDVFIEKPLAESFESAKKIFNLSINKDIIHSTGYLFGHIPLFQEAKSLLEKKILGHLYHFRSSIYISMVFGPKKGWLFEKSKSGGGAIINIGSHIIFLLYWLFGPLESVFSKIVKIYSKVEDSGTILFEFSNGLIGSLDVSWSIPGYRLSSVRTIIEGKNGLMEITDDYIKLYLYSKQGDFPKGWTTIHKIDLDKTSKFDLGGEGYYDEISHFIDCCLHRKKPVVSWKEGLEVQRIIEAIYKSADSNKHIYLKEVQ